MFAVARVLSVVLLALSSLVVAAGPSNADSNAPRLSSASRTSPDALTGGSPLAISWSASDEPEAGSGVRTVHFSYGRFADNGELLAWPVVAADYAPGPDGQSLATLALNPWTAEGRYILRSISVSDQIGNTTLYLRDGSVTAHPAVAAPPPSGVNFEALDFDVVNPLADVGLPVIESLRPVSKVVTAGEPLVLRSELSDDVSGVASVAVRYEGPSRVTEVRPAAALPLAPAGLLSAVVPRGAEGGLWQATVITIEDRAGNTVHYTRDNFQYYGPTGVRPYRPQPVLDFSSLDVEVVPGEPDLDAPTLQNLRREGPAQLRRGDDAMLSFATQDASPLEVIQFEFQDSTGHFFFVGDACMPERGFAMRPVEEGLDEGPVRLLSVSVWDSVGNVREYLRDGSVRAEGRIEPQPVSGYDLSAMDFELVAGTAQYKAPVDRPLTCPATAQLPVTLPDTAAVGQAVPVVGQVLTGLNAELPHASVAVFATPDDQAPELVDVTTTDEQGKFALSHVIGDRNTTYEARFLGRDGVAGADPTTSAPQTVKVSEPTTEPSPAADVSRLFGQDRFGTAIAISNDAWDTQQAQSAVLAGAHAFPDALAGTPLAVARSGPLLLTPSAALSSSTATELRRVLPAGRTVYLLGGTAALSPAVADAVTSLGYRVVRLGGADRYATAVRISGQLGTPKRIFQATGLTFQNALISGVAAAGTDGVVVLTADAKMPAATKAYLDSHPGVERIAVGAQAATADPSATKVAGANVYDTARLVAQRFFPTPTSAAVASGTVFADALAGGAHIGRRGGPLLLSEPTRLPAAIGDYLSTKHASIDTVILYGGPVALSTGVADAVHSSLRP